MLFRLSVLLPMVGDLNRPEATERLAVVGIDPEVEDPGRVPAGADKAHPGGAHPSGDIRENHVLAVTCRGTSRAIDRSPGLTAVERHLVVQPVLGIPGAVMCAEAQAN